MYHPAKILFIHRGKDRNVKSADDSTQATVEMWDENVFTCKVEKKIADKLKDNDVVLVDYSPYSEKVPIAKQTITKILYKKKAKEIWDKYKEHYQKKKKSVQKYPLNSYMG